MKVWGAAFLGTTPASTRQFTPDEFLSPLSTVKKMKGEMKRVVVSQNAVSITCSHSSKCTKLSKSICRSQLFETESMFMHHWPYIATTDIPDTFSTRNIKQKSDNQINLLLKDSNWFPLRKGWLKKDILQLNVENVTEVPLPKQRDRSTFF